MYNNLKSLIPKFHVRKINKNDNNLEIILRRKAELKRGLTNIFLSKQCILV